MAAPPRNRVVPFLRSREVLHERTRQELCAVAGGIWGSLGYFPAASAVFGHGNRDVIRRINFTNNYFIVSNIKGSVQFPGSQQYSPTPVVSALNDTTISGLVYEASSSNGLTIYTSDTLATVFQSHPGDLQYCSLSAASGKPTKFQVPTVAGGSVYYGCDGAVLHYGANPRGPSLQTLQQVSLRSPVLHFYPVVLIQFRPPGILFHIIILACKGTTLSPPA